jgi:hypothetical protein
MAGFHKYNFNLGNIQNVLGLIRADSSTPLQKNDDTVENARSPSKIYTTLSQSLDSNRADSPPGPTTPPPHPARPLPINVNTKPLPKRVSFSDQNESNLTFHFARMGLDKTSPQRVISDSQPFSPDFMPCAMDSPAQIGSSHWDDNEEPDLSISPTISPVSSVDTPHPSVSDPRPLLANVKRSCTTATYPGIGGRRSQSSSSFKPINSKSFDSLPTSAAVSFLSSLADKSFSNLTTAEIDDEGQEIGNYVMGKIISHGSTCVVREAFTFDPITNSPIICAVKVVRKKRSASPTEEKVFNELDHEISIWKKLQHPNVLQLIEVVDTDQARFIFMEYCPKGTLLTHVKNSKKLPEAEAKRVFLQLLDAVEYLHQELGIIHRDIKLDNILFDDNNNVKLADFGFSDYDRAGSPTAQTPADVPSACQICVGGTISYCSPEMLKVQLTSSGSDIWALGVVLYAMVAGTLPFSDGFEPRLIKKILNVQFAMKDEFSSDLKKLIENILKPKVDDRLTISQIRQSAWLQN